MEKKLFIGVLYLTIFVTFCFIILTTYLQRRLQTMTMYSDQAPVSKEINTPANNNYPSPQPTPTPIVWNTYIDRENGFSLEYPTTRVPYERVTDGYHSVDFYSGCMVITSGTEGQISKLRETTPIPWSKLDVLSGLAVGHKVSFVSDTWDLGQGKEFNLTQTYVKRSPTNIGGVSWNTFSVTNNFENHGNLMKYFVYKNDKLYLISSLTNGPCWIDEPERMLNSFKFIQ